MSDELHYHRIKNLIKGLIARTEDDNESNRLKWEAVGADSYEISLSTTSLRISSEDEEGDWYPYKFSMMNETGREIEEVHASSDAYDSFLLRDLFTAASRSHRGVGEKLTEVFEELGIPDPPPVSDDPWKIGSTADDEPPF